MNDRASRLVGLYSRDHPLGGACIWCRVTREMPNMRDGFYGSPAFARLENCWCGSEHLLCESCWTLWRDVLAGRCPASERYEDVKALGDLRDAGE